MIDPILKKLETNPVTQAILRKENRIGHLYPMEEDRKSVV